MFAMLLDVAGPRTPVHTGTRTCREASPTRRQTWCTAGSRALAWSYELLISSRAF